LSFASKSPGRACDRLAERQLRYSGCSRTKYAHSLQITEMERRERVEETARLVWSCRWWQGWVRWMRYKERHRPTASPSLGRATGRPTVDVHTSLTHSHPFSIPVLPAPPLSAYRASCSYPLCAHQRASLADTTPVTIAALQAVANARHRLGLVSGPVHHTLRSKCACLTRQDLLC
jgi:hypothetical protein